VPRRVRQLPLCRTPPVLLQFYKLLIRNPFPDAILAVASAFGEQIRAIQASHTSVAGHLAHRSIAWVLILDLTVVVSLMGAKYMVAPEPLLCIRSYNGLSLCQSFVRQIFCSYTYLSSSTSGRPSQVLLAADYSILEPFYSDSYWREENKTPRKRRIQSSQEMCRDGKISECE
jgi:hypothetical protein